MHCRQGTSCLEGAFRSMTPLAHFAPTTRSLSNISPPSVHSLQVPCKRSVCCKCGRHVSKDGVICMLHRNPVCARAIQLNISQFCEVQSQWHAPGSSASVKDNCPPQACPLELFYEYYHAYQVECFCAAPIRINYRLQSPIFSDFYPYVDAFKVYLTSSLNLKLHQLDIDSFSWEEGPRLRMHLKIFPDNVPWFKTHEISQIRSMFTGWVIPESDKFGPYELLNFTLLGPPYEEEMTEDVSSSQSKTGIIIGTITGAVSLSLIVSFIILRFKSKYQIASRKHYSSSIEIKINGIKSFTFQELSLATNKFSNSALVGKGGYGKVYRGVLADGTAVAIKRAEEGSLQGSKEFFTEMELLSRLHHRNLVSLIGYCDEEHEQLLVYEFVPNYTLGHHLSANTEGSLNFLMRLRIALGSARGILYLHTEANPPIVHRDIKSSNILLDSKFTAKVADLGLSRPAPVPDVEDSAIDLISSTVKGTPGYLDPEYLLTHQLTYKSDVYSLGVVFLEILTGMQPISHGKNIVREVSVAYRSGQMSSVIDSCMGHYPSECLEKFMSLALDCCLDDPDERPSMAKVVRELEAIYEMAPESNMVPSVTVDTDISNVECTLLPFGSNRDTMSSISPR